MIVYIASYPRAGNSLIRDIIEHGLHIPLSSVHPWPQPHPSSLAFASNWRPAEPSGGSLDRLSRDGTLFRYDRAGVNSCPDCLYLARGCGESLTLPVRRALADLPDVFAIKTHKRPFPSYYPGEYVIQPHRAAGPVLRSYVRLIQTRGRSGRLRPRWSILLGATRFGSFASYHRDWIAAAEDQRVPFLPLDFGHVVVDKAGAARAIAEFLQLDYDPDAVYPTFDEKHARDSRMFGHGTGAGWERSFGPLQRRYIRMTTASIEQWYGARSGGSGPR